MDKKLPVILIPGFFTSLRPEKIPFLNLRHDGFTVVYPSAYFISHYPLWFQATVLSKFVDQTLKEYGVEKCNLIGVSVGGVVALYYLQKLDGAKKVNNFISVCSPFGGVWSVVPFALTLGLFYPSLWEITPTSIVLKELREKEIPKELNLFFAFSGNDDKIVPPSSSRHPKARNLSLPGGHKELCLKENEKLLSFIAYLLNNY